jgi:hypothetical protein
MGGHGHVRHIDLCGNTLDVCLGDPCDHHVGPVVAGLMYEYRHACRGGAQVCWEGGGLAVDEQGG